MRGLCNGCFTSNVPTHLFPIDGRAYCKRCFDKKGKVTLEELNQIEEKTHCPNCNCKKDVIEAMKEIDILENVDLDE